MTSKKILFSVVLFFIISLQLIAGESSTYDFSWLDPDKEVYVLQNKVYRRKLRFYGNIGGGITTSGPFVETTVLQGRTGIFFTEDFGIEFLYSSQRNTNNDYELSVRMAGAVPFTRTVSNYYGGLLLWSPFYAKLNVFNFILYTDVLFGAGAAKLEDKNNKAEYGNTSDKTIISETHSAAMWDVGLRIYLFKHMDLRFDVIGTHYKAEFPDRFQGGSSAQYPSQTYNNYDVVASLGFII